MTWQSTASGTTVEQGNEPPANARVMRGHVKWFDQGKGFGFVVADEGGPDILLHANVLRNFGQNSIADGTGVEVAAHSTAKGMQAVELLRISEPESPPGEAREPTLAGFEGRIEDLPPVAARVKWFDKAKGFGFANVFGNPADVFIHIETLRRCGFADLMPGEAVCLRVIEGERGLMAAEVKSWDTVNKNADRSGPEAGSRASQMAPSGCR